MHTGGTFYFVGYTKYGERVYDAGVLWTLLPQMLPGTYYVYAIAVQHSSWSDLQVSLAEIQVVVNT
jgi:hypothetical protein